MWAAGVAAGEAQSPRDYEVSTRTLKGPFRPYNLQRQPQLFNFFF